MKPNNLKFSIKKRASNKNRRKYRSNIYTKPPTMKYELQCMGVGRTVANIDGTRTYEISENLYKYNILSEALASDEYLKYALDYRYVKILSITISVIPIVTATPSKKYFKFDWVEPEASYGPTDIARDDNAKVVYGNETKNIILKFKPPNANMAGSYGIAYNLSSWILTVDTINTPLNYIGYLSVLNTTQITVINWNIKMVFKGAVITQTAAKLSYLINRINIDEIQNIKLKIREREKQIKENEIREKESEEEEDQKEQKQEDKKQKNNSKNKNKIIKIEL